MKNLYLTFLFLFFLISNSIGQTLSGSINDNEGKPVSYSTVYVKELRFGIISRQLITLCQLIDCRDVGWILTHNFFQQYYGRFVLRNILIALSL